MLPIANKHFLLPLVHTSGSLSYHQSLDDFSFGGPAFSSDVSSGRASSRGPTRARYSLTRAICSGVESQSCSECCTTVSDVLWVRAFLKPDSGDDTVMRNAARGEPSQLGSGCRNRRRRKSEQFGQIA